MKTTSIRNSAMLRRFGAPCVSALAIALALPITADQAAAQNRALEEVIVTAQKREQSINEVPIAISAYTPQQLSSLGIDSAEDLEILTPGLEINSVGGVGTKVWTIRGVGFNDYSTGASSTVGLYFDEIAFPYPVMATGIFFDTDRVEVLRGPQGDLYGRNTTAGQVSYFSARPSEVFEAGVSLTYGRYRRLDTEAYISGPITDNFRARVAATTTHSNKGWQESLSRPGDRLGHQDKWAVRTVLDADLGDDATFTLVVNFNKDESDNVANTPFDGREVGLPTPTLQANANTGGALEPFVIFSTDDNEAADWTNGPNDALRPQRDNRTVYLSGKLVWDVGWAELTSLTGYITFDREEANDWDGVALLDSSNINISEIDAFSQEVRLSGTTDRFFWVGGLYYSYDEVDEDYNYYFGEGRFGINQLDTRYMQETESIAAFAHVDYDITDRIGLIVGARFTHETREWEGCTFDNTPTDIPVAGLPLNVFLNNIINGPGVITPNGLLNDGFNFPNGLGPVTPLEPNGCGTFNDILGSENAGQYTVFAEEIETNRAMWKVGLDYSPNDDILLYATISQGFKSGGFNGANSNTTSQLLPYDPEVLTAYEIGLKATLLEGTMQFNASAFYYNYNDKQENEAAVTPVGNIGGLSNIPESRIYGFEAEMQWQATDALRVFASMSFLDTEVQEWDQVDELASAFPTTVLRDASGAELPNAPKFSGNLTAAYDIPVADNYLVTPAFDLIYRGETSGDITAEWFRESYTLVNARLTVAEAFDNRWMLQLFVRNLADNDYYVSGQSGGNFTRVRTNGMPRTWGVKIDYRF